MPRLSRIARPRAARRAPSGALVGLLALLALVACGGGARPEPAPAPTSAPSGTPAAAGAAAQPAAVWPVRTSEHVDLWLHGLALLMDDTTRVPLFRRGYRESMRTLRAQGNVLTQLDAERDRLRQRFAVNRQLPLAAQFVPLAFGSWEDLRRAITLFLQAGGDPRRASDQGGARAIALLAGTFASAPDREWLRIFAAALDDESTRFYHRHWLTEQRDRSPALAAADSVWQRVARPALTRFLNNTGQRNGELLLALPLGGEGRTTSGGDRANLMAVGFPARQGDPGEVAYAAAHEAVGTLVGTAVSDHVTPAEQRAGVADRYVSAAQVRGGLLLVQRTAPALAAGYARFYLREAGVSAGADPVAALVAAFALPQPIIDAIARQIDVTLGGI
jgi:hypothetical protein